MQILVIQVGKVVKSRQIVKIAMFNLMSQFNHALRAI